MIEENSYTGSFRNTSIMDSFLKVQHHAGRYRSKRARKGGREGSRQRRTGLGKLNKGTTPGQSRSLFHNVFFFCSYFHFLQLSVFHLKL